MVMRHNSSETENYFTHNVYHDITVKQGCHSHHRYVIGCIEGAGVNVGCDICTCNVFLNRVEGGVTSLLIANC